MSNEPSFEYRGGGSRKHRYLETLVKIDLSAFKTAVMDYLEGRRLEYQAEMRSEFGVDGLYIRRRWDILPGFELSYDGQTTVAKIYDLARLSGLEEAILCWIEDPAKGKRRLSQGGLYG